MLLWQQIQTDYNAVRMSCNTWRNYWDVSDDFNSVKSIVNFYGKNNDLFRKYSGPGGFFDPDQVMIIHVHILIFITFLDFYNIS